MHELLDLPLYAVVKLAVPESQGGRVSLFKIFPIPPIGSAVVYEGTLDDCADYVRYAESMIYENVTQTDFLGEL